MKIVTCVYGDDYVPMLAGFLETWGRSFEVVVAVADVFNGLAKEIESTYGVKVIEVDVTLSSRANIRISQKMVLWDLLADECAGEDFVVFADADTLLVGNIDDFFAGDIVITRREPGSKFLINTGVVGFSGAAIRAGIVRRWRDETETILSDLNKLSKPYP